MAKKPSKKKPLKKTVRKQPQEGSGQGSSGHWGSDRPKGGSTGWGGKNK